MVAAEPAPQLTLLWDLDNIMVKRAEVAGLAKVLADLGGPEVHRVASGHRLTCRTVGGPVRAAGFTVHSAGRRPEAADRLLLRQARQRSQEADQWFWVASCDGSFARVAAWGPLLVLTLDEARVSRTLAAKADAILVLMPSDAGWRVRYASAPADGHDQAAAAFPVEGLTATT